MSYTFEFFDCENFAKHDFFSTCHSSFGLTIFIEDNIFWNIYGEFWIPCYQKYTLPNLHGYHKYLAQKSNSK